MQIYVQRKSEREIERGESEREKPRERHAEEDCQFCHDEGAVIGNMAPPHTLMTAPSYPDEGALIP